jgi:hypothetical protein
MYRLVESLVVRELERGPAGTGAAAASNNPPRAHRRPSSVSSEASSLAELGPPGPAGGRSGGSGVGNLARVLGTRAGHRGLGGDDGVPLQVAALQVCPFRGRASTALLVLMPPASTQTRVLVSMFVAPTTYPSAALLCLQHCRVSWQCWASS